MWGIPWVAKLSAVSVFLQSLEMLFMRRGFADHGGIWSWKILKKEFESLPRPIFLLFDAAFSEKGFTSLLVLRLLFAGLVLLPVFKIEIQGLLMLYLFLSTVLISVRWRGTFNGGSDYMSVLVLGSTGLALMLSGHPWVVRGCAYYIAIQLILSYLFAGFCKVGKRDWWTGKALANFVLNSEYAVPQQFKRFKPDSFFFKMSSWSILIFECSFPVALLDLRICAAYLLMAGIFHLGVFYIFGLNRFFFAWVAGYPAIWAMAQRLHF